jgi:ankyrin repeat protein
MLREAVRNGDLQKVKQAMANGLDINATDGDNNTALDLASKNKEIADLLRKHGAKTGEELKDKAK